MGPLQVVRRAPPVEGGLALRQRLVVARLEHLCLKAAMKALGFALSLGVVGAAVDHVDAEAKERRIELRVQRAPEPLGRRYAPREPAVSQDASRQAVALKDGGQPLFDHRIARSHSTRQLSVKGKARVIVHDRDTKLSRTCRESAEACFCQTGPSAPNDKRVKV